VPLCGTKEAYIILPPQLITAYEPRRSHIRSLARTVARCAGGAMIEITSARDPELDAQLKSRSARSDATSSSSR
jgi:hypothetical protein